MCSAVFEPDGFPGIIVKSIFQYLEKPVDLDLLMKKINDAQHKRIRELEKNSRDDVKKILKSRGW